MIDTQLVDRASAGLAVRRQVLGDSYVDAAINAATAFSEPLQEFLNEGCWGLAWTREGLDLKSRSLVTLTALAAGNKWSEFATHTRGAINNGWTAEELREAILHMSVYLGVPTALEAFRTIAPVIAERESGVGG